MVTEYFKCAILNSNLFVLTEKIKEVSKFHKECKQLFGRSDAFIPPISTSPPPQHNNSHNGAAYSNLTPLPHIMPFSPNNHRSSNLSRQDCDSLTTFNNNNNNSNDTLLPHLTDDRMRSLPSPSHTSRGQW